MHYRSFIAALGLAAASLQAQAALISSPAQLPGAQVIVDFNNEDGLFIGTGQQYTTGTPAVTFSAIDGDFTVGQRVATDLGINGAWGAGASFLSFDKVGDMTLRIDFNGVKTRAFLADFSLFEEAGDHRLLTVTAYGTDGSSQQFTLGSFATSLDGVDLNDQPLIDSSNFAITQGIRLANAEIAYVTIQGDGVVLDNFRFTAAVPEPETWGLLLAGLGVTALSLRRRAA